MASSSDNGKATERDTKRVVLRRHRVIVAPEALVELTTENAKAIATALGVKNIPPLEEAWIVVGEFEGASKTKAIEAHAGKPGTPDAKPGVYKAPSVSAFAGGEEYVKPAQPKVERRALVD